MSPATRHQRKLMNAARLTGLALVCVQLGGLAHMALVRHGECSDGQLVDLHLNVARDAQRAPDYDAGISQGEAGSQLELQHQHCEIPTHLKRAAVSAKPWASAFPLDVAARGQLEARPALQPRAPLQVAPKQSPPA